MGATQEKSVRVVRFGYNWEWSVGHLIECSIRRASSSDKGSTGWGPARLHTSERQRKFHRERTRRAGLSTVWGFRQQSLCFMSPGLLFIFFFCYQKNLIKSVIWQRKMAGEIMGVIWEEVGAGNSDNSKSLPKVLRCHQACLR